MSETIGNFIDISLEIFPENNEVHISSLHKSNEYIIYEDEGFPLHQISSGHYYAYISMGFRNGYYETIFNHNLKRMKFLDIIKRKFFTK